MRSARALPYRSAFPAGHFLVFFKIPWLQLITAKNVHSVTALNSKVSYCTLWVDLDRTVPGPPPEEPIMFSFCLRQLPPRSAGHCRYVQ